MKKRNLFAKDLFSKKYSKRIVKPKKKEKVVIVEKNLRKSSTNFLYNL